MPWKVQQLLWLKHAQDETPGFQDFSPEISALTQQENKVCLVYRVQMLPGYSCRIRGKNLKPSDHPLFFYLSLEHLETVNHLYGP